MSRTRPEGALPLRIGFVLTSDFTLSALADFVDVLRLAADDADQSRPIRCQWNAYAARLIGSR